jgi:hypothetical protein
MVIVMININIITITVIVIMIVYTLLCDCYDNINFHTMQGFFFFFPNFPQLFCPKNKNICRKRNTGCYVFS